MRLTWRAVAWGLLGSLVLLALWFRPDPPRPAEAQGVGILSRATCSQVTSPVQGQTFCFDGTDNVLKVYNGTAFATVTANNAATIVSLIGAAQNNLVGQGWDARASGSTQQVGAAYTITGATPSLINFNSFRIALYAGAETRGGGEAVMPINVSAIARSVDTAATVNMMQMTLGQNQANSALNCTAPCYNGISIANTGSGVASYGMTLGGVGKWMQGYEIDSGAISSSGFAIHYKGDGVNGPVVVTAPGTVEIGFAAVGLGNPNELHFLNEKSIQGLDAAGTTLIQIAKVSAANNIALDTGNRGTTIGGGLTVGSPTGGVIASSVNVASATYANGAGAVIATGSKINHANVNSISATGRLGATLRGNCTFAAAQSCTSTFTTNEPDTSYFVAVGCTGNDPIAVQTKAVTGITFFASRSQSNSCDWIMVR